MPDLDDLLKAELERLQRENPEKAARVLEEALNRPLVSKARLGPSLPSRTQHHSPLESESVFVRYSGWWDELECQTCQHVERRFDGLFEERAWIRPQDHPASGAKHWLKASSRPLSELLETAVTYVRYHYVTFCHKCCGAESWPVADSYTVDRSIDVNTARQVYQPSEEVTQDVTVNQNGVLEEREQGSDSTQGDSEQISTLGN